MTLIQLVSLRPDDNPPQSAVKYLPEWYKKAKKYHETGESTYKNCVPFFDGMSSGYVFTAPCDVTFYLENGTPKVGLPEGYEDFVSHRSPMGDFQVPDGYYPEHFAWFPRWGLRTPPGYSVLYTTPLNGFSLPFIDASGIINNDKVFIPGSMPFFLKKNFEGVIEKGTPYVQAIPFKRENWTSEVVHITKDDVGYFKPESDRIKNLYRNDVWERVDYA